MIDVLGDLHGFACKNNMPKLAHQLEQSLRVALSETASIPEEAPLQVIGQDGTITRTIYREAGTSLDA